MIPLRSMRGALPPLLQFRLTPGISVILGIAALWYGSFLILGPRGPISHDELNFIFEALRLPGEGRISGYMHGPLLYELIACVEVALYVAARVLGWAHSPAEFLVFVLKDIPLHLTLGRSMTAAAGMLAVFQTYRLGRLLGGESAGLIGAVFCLTNLTFFVMSSMCKEDALFWAFSLSAMDLAWHCLDGKGPRRAALAGVCIAAAFCAKYLALFSPLLILVPLVRAKREEMARAVRLSLIIGVSALLGLLVFYPFLFTDTHSVRASFRETQAGSAATGPQWAMAAYAGHHLRNLIGWPLLLAAALEFFRRLWRDPRGPAILFLVPVLQFIAIGLRSGWSMAHYAFPLASACFILAGTFLAAVLGGFPNAARAVPWVVMAVVIGDGAYLRGTIKYALMVTGPRTSDVARDYLVANARPGDCVGMNYAAAGENHAGPDLLAENFPAGTGSFTRARAAANGAKSGPRYFVQLGNHTSLPGDLRPGCEWLVIGRRGKLSHVEMGTAAPEVASTSIPPGYEKKVTITAFPEEHSNYAPHLTTLDYDELRRTSIAEIWRRRAKGLHFDIYRAQP